MNESAQPQELFNITIDEFLNNNRFDRICEVTKKAGITCRAHLKTIPHLKSPKNQQKLLEETLIRVCKQPKLYDFLFRVGKKEEITSSFKTKFHIFIKTKITTL
jgi:hypothetical protein